MKRIWLLATACVLAGCNLTPHDKFTSKGYACLTAKQLAALQQAHWQNNNAVKRRLMQNGCILVMAHTKIEKVKEYKGMVNFVVDPHELNVTFNDPRQLQKMGLWTLARNVSAGELPKAR